jgi:hypothetical protein
VSDVERSLRALADEVEWPATPDIAGRLELGPPRRRRRRRLVVVAVAAALLAVAIAFAVPPARSSILRFLHLGGVTVERVSVLPPAAERPLRADLGSPVTRARARAILGAPFRVPPVEGEPKLYERDGTVSALLADPGPVLLTETAFTGLMKKLAATSEVEAVQVEPGVDGIWIAGPAHVFYGPELPPRLAANVLVWERGGVTYRLEGRSLTKDRALGLARAMAEPS